MKKKLALLLATVMAISTVSVNLFASSDNSLSKTPVTAVNLSVFPEDHTGTDNRSMVPGVEYTSTDTFYKTNGATQKTDELKYLISGMNLEMKANNAVAVGSTFRLKLTNSEFFFRNAGYRTSQDVTVNSDGTISYAKPSYARPATTAVAATAVTSTGAVAVKAGAFTSAVKVISAASTKNYTDRVDNQFAGYYRVYSAASFRGGDEQAGNASTFDMTKGFLMYGGSSNSSTYFRATYENTAGAEVIDTSASYTVPGTSLSLDWRPVYKLEVYESDPTMAIVTMIRPIQKDETVLVPLVTRSLGAGNTSVQILQDLSSFTGNTHVYASNSSTLTKTYAYEVVEARTNFDLKDIIVSESRFGSIQSGTFEIIAPSGFEFKDNINQTDSNGNKVVNVRFEGGLNNSSNYLTAFPSGNASGRLGIRFKDVDDGLDYSVLQFSVNIGAKSSLSPGAMYISGLELLADEDAPWGDVNFKIRSFGKDTVLTEETFLAAKRMDWTITFTTKGDIPTLVTGRYVPESEGSGMANAEDSYHKTAIVVFKENSVSAWWAERQTKFVLSDGVKIRKFQIKEAKNMYQNFNVTPNIDMQDSLKEPDITGTKAGYVDIPYTAGYMNAKGNGFYNTGDFGKDLYPNDGKKHGYVKVDDSTITLENLKILQDKKADLELHLWVSIAADFVGDVKLTATGSAVPETLEPITIAKTMQPVTIDTKVTDIKIGYQYYKVADFTLTETKVGMLEKGKEVRVSISDAISSDMAFTPGFKYEANNIKIKDAKVYASQLGSARGTLGEVGKDNARLSFVIDSASSTNVGVIKFSNVQVKIDRTVPESSVPYDMIVWGTAVAANYGTLKDQFQVPGIRAPYVKVVTSATNNGAISATVVKVKIGDPVIQVGPTTYTMDTAAYVSETSESTMVPVRFISVALGVPEGKVNWDPIKSTVTIDASQSNSTRIIQMTTGSDQIIVNGMSQTMFSPNMTPVKMEIKEDRAFIPMRALGDALGVQVGWDADTKTAIYNPDLDNSTAPTTAAPAATTPAPAATTTPAPTTAQ